MSSAAHSRQPDDDYPPAGSILYKAQTDRYGNDVSLITTPGGHKFRMVHHFTGYRRRRKYTVYAPGRRYVRVKTYSPESDIACHSVEIAGFSVSWGDGDNLGGQCKAHGLDLTAELGAIGEDNFDAVILAVLDAIAPHANVWEVK